MGDIADFDEWIYWGRYDEYHNDKYPQYEDNGLPWADDFATSRAYRRVVPKRHLAQRNAPVGIWIDTYGVSHRIKEMDTQYITNCYNWCKRNKIKNKAAEFKREIDARQSQEAESECDWLDDSGIP